MQKIKEWIIAAKIEKRYTKDEIITMYLNRFDWVNNAVGIKSAAAVYFNKKPGFYSITGVIYQYVAPNRGIKQYERFQTNILLNQ